MPDLAVFDSDGHIDEDNAAIAGWFQGEYRNPRRPVGFQVFPSLDGWSRGVLVNRGDPERPYRHTNAAIWGEVLDRVGLTGTVLYPTEGLAVGLVQDAAYAVALSAAYNDWMQDAYCSKDDRLLGVALLPLQSPQAAVRELRRSAARPGFVAGLLPTVTATTRTLGDEVYWPIYEEAERLGMPLALHGGPAQNLGLDHFTDFAKVHALSHPLAMLRQATDLVLSGVFDAFPDLRVALLEAGCGWVPFFMDRLDHEWSSLNGLQLRQRLKHRPSHYFRETDNLWLSLELSERSMRYTIDAIGSERLLYSSDYGHETPLGEIGEDLRAFLDDPRYDAETKQRILHDNGQRFYFETRGS
jgi:predicted TIM-barrel fold metal-dependent hydrolase